MLQIGDKVKVIENISFKDDYSQEYFIDKIGTIKEIDEQYGNLYMVEFDERIENNEGDNISQDTFFDISELEFIPKYNISNMLSNLDELERRI